MPLLTHAPRLVLTDVRDPAGGYLYAEYHRPRLVLRIWRTLSLFAGIVWRDTWGTGCRLDARTAWEIAVNINWRLP